MFTEHTKQIERTKGTVLLDKIAVKGQTDPLAFTQYLTILSMQEL